MTIQVCRGERNRKATKKASQSGNPNHYTTAPLILCYVNPSAFNANIEAVIHLSGIKPNCCSPNVTSPLNLIYVTLSTNRYGVTHQFDLFVMILLNSPPFSSTLPFYLSFSLFISSLQYSLNIIGISSLCSLHP